MFYKFNSVSGRLTASQLSDAYIPQGLSGKEAVEVPLIWHSSDVKAANAPTSGDILGSHGVNPTSAMGLVPNNPTYKKLMKIQADWAKTSHLLVWQKRPVDALLFYASIGLVTIGLSYTAAKVYGFLYPSKKK